MCRLMTHALRKPSASIRTIESDELFLAAFEKAANAFDKKHTRTKSAARKQLTKEKVLTRSGHISRLYGG